MVYTVSLEVARQLKESKWDKETQYGYRDDGEFESNFVGYDIPAPTLGELIRHPLLKKHIYWWEEIRGELLFWVEPPDANSLEDLFSEENPEDALGLALIHELKKANTE